MSVPQTSPTELKALKHENERLIFANKLLRHGFDEAIRQRDEFANLLFATQAELQNLKNNQPTNNRAPRPKPAKLSKENQEPSNAHRTLTLLSKKWPHGSSGKELEIRTSSRSLSAESSEQSSPTKVTPMKIELAVSQESESTKVDKPEATLKLPALNAIPEIAEMNIWREAHSSEVFGRRTLRDVGAS